MLTPEEAVVGALVEVIHEEVPANLWHREHIPKRGSVWRIVEVSWSAWGDFLLIGLEGMPKTGCGRVMCWEADRFRLIQPQRLDVFRKMLEPAQSALKGAE